MNPACRRRCRDRARQGNPSMRSRRPFRPFTYSAPPTVAIAACRIVLIAAQFALSLSAVRRAATRELRPHPELARSLLLHGLRDQLRRHHERHRRSPLLRLSLVRLLARLCRRQDSPGPFVGRLLWRLVLAATMLCIASGRWVADGAGTCRSGSSSARSCSRCRCSSERSSRTTSSTWSSRSESCLVCLCLRERHRCVVGHRSSGRRRV